MKVAFQLCRIAVHCNGYLSDILRFDLLQLKRKMALTHNYRLGRRWHDSAIGEWFWLNGFRDGGGDWGDRKSEQSKKHASAVDHGFHLLGRCRISPPRKTVLS